jgi:hypothetical protein
MKTQVPRLGQTISSDSTHAGLSEPSSEFEQFVDPSILKSLMTAGESLRPVANQTAVRSAKFYLRKLKTT